MKFEHFTVNVLMSKQIFWHLLQLHCT